MIIRPSQVVRMVRNLPDNAGDKGSIPALGRSAGGERQSILLLVPGGFCGQKSLLGYSSWGHKETDTTAAI